MPSHLWAPHRPSSVLLRTFWNLPNGAVLEVLCKCRKNIQNEPFDFASIRAIGSIHSFALHFILSIIHSTCIIFEHVPMKALNKIAYGANE